MSTLTLCFHSLMGPIASASADPWVMSSILAQSQYSYGDWSRYNFYGHPPLLLFHEGLTLFKLKKIVGSNNCSAQFIKIISYYKKIGYNIIVLQQTACLVVKPITAGNYAFLLNCTPVGRTSDSMTVPT